MQSFTLLTSSSLSILGPLVSPAKTTLLVVVKVSHATLENGSLDRYVSTTYEDSITNFIWMTF